MKVNVNNQGFTLIETLIAILVVTIGILGVAMMQIQSIDGNAKAFNVTEATALALSRAEIILASNLDWDTGIPLIDNNGTNYQRMNYEVVGMINPLGVPAVADGSAPSGDEFTTYWDYTPVADPGDPFAVPIVAPPVPAVFIGSDVRVDVVWREKGNLRTVTVDFVKTRF